MSTYDEALGGETAWEVASWGSLYFIQLYARVIIPGPPISRAAVKVRKNGEICGILRVNYAARLVYYAADYTIFFFYKGTCNLTLFYQVSEEKNHFYIVRQTNTA